MKRKAAETKWIKYYLALLIQQLVKVIPIV